MVVERQVLAVGWLVAGSLATRTCIVVWGRARNERGTTTTLLCQLVLPRELDLDGL